jgi:hypothetical protein
MQRVQRRCSRWNLTAADWTSASLPTTTCTEHLMQKKRSFASVGIDHLVPLAHGPIMVQDRTMRGRVRRTFTVPQKGGTT